MPIPHGPVTARDERRVQVSKARLSAQEIQDFGE